MQNSHENIWTAVSFLIKLQAEWRPVTVFKKDSYAGISLCILANFEEHFFTEDIQVTASAVHRIFFFRTIDCLITNWWDRWWLAASLPISQKYDQRSHKFSKRFALLKYPGRIKLTFFAVRNNHFKDIWTFSNIYIIFCAIWYHL